ncbi:MAG: hypothetical protein IID30_12065, partial [Planctomycetes bacterium]|nr:hypothetical protein [Planctomycetota bacterium]
MKRSHIFGVLLMTLAVCSSHAFAQGTLLVWWKLDESSGTTVNDSANSNNGLISGNPVWQSSGGYIDGALEFDGSGDQIEDSDAENFLNGLTAFTVSLWIESDLTNVDKGIFITQDPSSSDNILSMRYDKVGAAGGQNEVIKFAIKTSSGSKNYESSALVQTTSWQHLAITWSSNETPKFYINGTLDTLSYDGGSLGGSISDVTKLIVGIGVKSNIWDGRIDDFRIYDGALTASEVNDLYNLISPVSHHWKFNETTGTTAADSLGSSDGTLTNFPGDNSQWSCLEGGSLIFDGSDDYVSLPTEADYDFTEFVSIAAWIKVTSFTVAEQAIVTKGDIAYRLERDGSTDMLKFTVDGLTTNTVVQGSVSVNDGLWHHVAGVYDGSELLLYIDGVEDNAVTATGTMDTNNSAVYIGANAAVGGRNFNGAMNDVYIHNYALTPSTIQSLAVKPQLGWWKLDESSGTTASDSGPNANNGTLQSMDGTEWTTARIDGGLDFSGSSDYINTNVASSDADSITMMGWFMSDDAGSIGNSYVTQRFMTQRDASSSSRFGLGINNNYVAVYWDDGGHNIQEATAITLVAGQWYHAAVTYDETTVRLYVNGVEEGNWPESNLSTPSSDTFEIGRGGGSRYFDGVLDDMLLYDRALCASEIYAVYDSFVYFTDVSGSVGFDVQSSDDVTSGAGLHWADYDNDGDLDAIVTGNNFARLYLSTNEGDSFFVANFGGGNYPRQGAMLDIDNDGDID